MIDYRQLRHSCAYFLLAFFLLLSPIAALCSGAEFIIFHTSDIHGSISAHPDPTAKEEPKPLIGGFAVLKKLMDNYKNDPAHAKARFLYFDSGDYFQGTPIVDRTKGSVMIDMFNRVGVNAVTIGNHDFDYTYQNLKEQFKNRKFPVICCNVIENSTGKIPDFAVPFKVFSHNGKKIGLIGIDTPATKMMSIEANVKDLEFLAPAPLVEKYVKLLRNSGVDFIALLSHLGIDDDIKLLVEQVRGIDIVFGGHSHILKKGIETFGPDNTILIHSGSSLEHTSILTVKLEDDGSKKIFLKSQPLYVDEIGSDNKISAVEEEYLKEIKKEMSRVIGVSKVNLYRGINGGDSPEGSFIADAMRKAVNADFAFINFGGVRQPIYKGTITVEHIFLVQPFSNVIEVLDMTGAQIKEMIEKYLSNDFQPMNDNDKAYALDHFNIRADGLRMIVGPYYGYLFPSNLKITFDPARPAMQRLISVERIDGKQLVDNETYKVALNDFLASGGDGFLFLKDIKNRYKSSILVRDALIKYIEENKVIESKPEKRMHNVRLNEESLD
ncbi:MAG: bifunctional UDP-sugar hydrolase/5'-nucleotidase [Candidatus Rifleibacteriota bacterium]